MSEDTIYCSFVSIHYIICECGETFPSEEDLKIHLEETHGPKKERTEYKCGICDAIYDSQEECIQHYEESHINEEIEYTADEQEFDVKDEKIVIQTEPEAEDFATQSNLDVKKEKKRKYQKKNIVCEVCGKRYASNAALKYHQRVHTGERPYKCTECDKSFTMPLFLQLHCRTHTGEKPYQCPQCPKAFSNRAALLRHSRVHTGIKPYQCPRCGKCFTQSNSMKLHVNTVHLKQPAPYKSKNRKLKALEREFMRNAALKKYKHEDKIAVASIKQALDVDQDISNLEIIDQSEILYEDVDSQNVTYEVIYEE